MPKSAVFIPCSGFSGENLLQRTDNPLASWYTGPVIFEAIGLML